MLWGPLRRNATLTTTPSPTTSRPAPSAISRVESSPSRTKPVRSVPPSAPSVPTAESPPTVAPVCSSAASRSFTTAGCAIESARIAGPLPAPTTASVASDPPSSRRGPSPSTIGRASSTSTPATISVGPSVVRGSTTSANCPPTHAPAAIPSSAIPIAAE